MTKPYIIVSDCHFHNWSAFSKTNEDGINSRLQTQIDEFKRAVTTVKKLGGDTIYNAGDTFHVRGKVETTVLNPVVDLFKWVQDQGIHVYSIPGNHDLASEESDVIGNAAQSLTGVINGEGGVSGQSYMCNSISEIGDVVMFPWMKSIDELKASLESHADSQKTAIIHAPVNGVIMNIPDHGLDADYLGKLGYKRVFSGHYHNHKDFGNGVYSIGAMTHQTWGDIGTKAGFIAVHGDRVHHSASHAPKFIGLDPAMDSTDIELVADGNYVRVVMNVEKESDASDMRDWLKESGAQGVSIHPIRNLTPTARTEATVKSGASVKASVADFIVAKKYDRQKELNALCLSIISESEGVE